MAEHKSRRLTNAIKKALKKKKRTVTNQSLTKRNLVMSHLVPLGFIVCSHNSSSAGWLDVLIPLESTIYALLANSVFMNSTILMQNKTSIDNKCECSLTPSCLSSLRCVCLGTLRCPWGMFCALGRQMKSYCKSLELLWVGRRNNTQVECVQLVYIQYIICRVYSQIC